MRTMTISVSPTQEDRIQQAVEKGAYASSSEAARDALQLWEQREEIRSLEIAELKQAYDEGMASGASRVVETEKLLADFKANALARG